MTDSEYALLANAVTELDAAILRQMKRRAETKNRLYELLDVAELLFGKARKQGNIESAQCKSVLKELRKTIETTFSQHVAGCRLELHARAAF